MSVNIQALWDHAQPALSEQRFIAALATASADEQLLLQTQIARTHGIRRDFDRAREILATVQPRLAGASAEARVRYRIELGRTHVSTTHLQTALTPEALATARQLYLEAFDLAAAARLDFLAIDALHMMVCVDADPDDQLAWNRKAVDHMMQSDQADARGWEGSLRNNIGHALHLKGEYDAALVEFGLSKAAHERLGRVRPARIADWMTAWTLRAMHRHEQALAIQLALAQAWDADGQPDPYVYEELAHLYRALGDAAQAEHCDKKFKAVSS